MRLYSWLWSSASPTNTTPPRLRNTGMDAEQHLAPTSASLQSLMNSQKWRLLENLLFQTGGETESSTGLLIRIQLRVASKTDSSQQLAWLTRAARRPPGNRKIRFPGMPKSHLRPTFKTRPSEGDPPDCPSSHDQDMRYKSSASLGAANSCSAFISFALQSICHHWSLLHVIYSSVGRPFHSNTRRPH